jgi:xylonate dehydratase
LLRLRELRVGTKDILTQAAFENAMVVYAAFGGSTNLLLHLPAIAHAAGRKRPSVADWVRVNREVPRLVDALPNGPKNFATVQVFLAGGVPEVMLHLRATGLLDTKAMTAAGVTLDECLDWWQQSERRRALRQNLRERDGIDPDRVIFSPDRAREAGLTSTVCFPKGNLAPEGSVVKSTAIDPSLIGDDGVFFHRGPARVFTLESDAIEAIRKGQIAAGDVMVLICCGPKGAGMQEIYQITAALKALPHCRHVALLTDGRFSGVSTGPCIGHISPEALAGGPVGKLCDGDMIEIRIDRANLNASVDLVSNNGHQIASDEGARALASRLSRDDLRPHPQLPDDTRLWAALVEASGGIWAGCVYDVDAIAQRLSDDQSKSKKREDA